MGATMYGAKVIGVKPQHLATIRSLIRSTTSSTIGGSSATAVLALQKGPLVDPAFTAIGRPVLEWAVRVNKAHYEDNHSEINLLKDAWQAHIGDMLITNREGGDMWKKVRGPATAVMASLCGINWKPRAYYQWETDTGETVNLRDEIP